MVTSVTLSLPLATEPAEWGIMNRPPRDPKRPLLSVDFLIRVLLVSGIIGMATIAVFFIELNVFHLPLANAQSAAVTMLAMGQIAYLFSCRFLYRSSLTLDVFRGNRMLWYSIGALILLQIIFLYVPFMHNIFSAAAVNIQVWLVCLGISYLIFLAIEAIKAIGRMINPPQQVRR